MFILLIPVIEIFLPITIFKMAATITQKINIVRYHHNLIDYNLTIMKSPKPATDNRFKK
jgi:hypothetical protein